MGFAALHIAKASGNDSGMSAHIERKTHPKNADEKRTHLNRELIEFADGVENRTDAIQHRLKNGGLTRKVGKNQVTAIRVLLSGTHEDLIQIEKEGRLNDWCKDNVKWLNDTFGEKNVVSAVLHMDEKTPHIHATVVPIVTGERRKAKQENKTNKRKYKKKKADRPRLCADDVMARDKLEGYHDTYAEYMQPYGLQRGIKGREVRHIGIAEYYRTISKEITQLEEALKNLRSAEKELKNNLDSLDTKEKVEKAKGQIYNFVGNLFSNRKLEELQEENNELKQGIDNLKSEITRLKNTFEKDREENKNEFLKYEKWIDHIYKLFPGVKAGVELEKLCNSISLPSQEFIKLLREKSIQFTGKLFSPINHRFIEVQDVSFKLAHDPKTGNAIILMDNLKMGDWFRKKHQEIQKMISTKKHTRKNIIL